MSQNETLVPRYGRPGAPNERDVRTREQGSCQVRVSQVEQGTSVTFEGGLWVPLCRSRCPAHALVSVVSFTCVVFRAGVGVCVDGLLARGVPRMRMRGRMGGCRYRGGVRTPHLEPFHRCPESGKPFLSRERKCRRRFRKTGRTVLAKAAQRGYPLRGLPVTLESPATARVTNFLRTRRRSVTP